MDTDKSVLLSSGHRMPLVGLGTWQTSDEDLTRVALEAAVDAGYRLIDTALVYNNEAFMGRTLNTIFQRGTVKREDLFIVTKLPCNALRPEAVEHFCKLSLTDLQLEYIDLYLIHTPIAAKRTEDDREAMPVRDGELLVDTEVDLVETWKAMEKLVDKGLVKSIGLSNFNSQQIQRIYDAARIKPANLQVECHAYLPQYELQEFCRKLNISFTAYSPLGTPGLVDFAKKAFGVEVDNPRLMEDSRLKPLCEKHDKTPAQVLLRYLIQRGIIVIPKSSNPKRLQDNIRVFDFSLSDDEMSVLKSMGKNFRYFDFCYFKGVKEHPEYPFDIPY